jgi:hypothetical protein
MADADLSSAASNTSTNRSTSSSTVLGALDTKPHTVVALETATGLRRGLIEALVS